MAVALVAVDRRGRHALLVEAVPVVRPHLGAQKVRLQALANLAVRLPSATRSEPAVAHLDQHPGRAAVHGIPPSAAAARMRVR
jgi:hypothetical protein